MSETVVELQRELRSELKEPLGPIYTDVDAMLADSGDPIVAVGDVVTYHLLQGGRVPDVALVDRQTERSEVDQEITDAIEGTGFDREVRVANPAATITDDLVEAMAEAIGDGGTTLIHVDGEEDLATLPVVLMVPESASVVYGQPGEGMVLVAIDAPTTEWCRDLLSRMEGDTERLWALLDGQA